jgi:hypothetical protein
MFSIAVLVVIISATARTAMASSLQITSGVSAQCPSGVEADYTTSHLFIDELANESVPITVCFDPQTTGVESAEVFTNLNRRDKAASDPDRRGVEEGIEPPPGNEVVAGDDRHYYKAYPMLVVANGYRLVLSASRCGAYRLTARYRLKTDPLGTYHWYGDERNAKGIVKRDHAIVITPTLARDLQIYEINPLTMTATGTLPAQRGTFAKLAHPAAHGQAMQFSLAYVRQLGVNTLWLQPIHPRGIDGRAIDPNTHKPFTLGSPYSVKNFFAVTPLMASTFNPGDTPESNDSEAGRAQALAEFREFVQVANTQGLRVFLDVPFNHAAHDAELSSAGMTYWGNSAATPSTQIRAAQPLVFSHVNEYDERATNADAIAVAPDRFDFGKWPDVFDIYFGRYAALVPNASMPEEYKDEEDWFDYSVGSDNSAGRGNGHFDQITQHVWQFFGDYLQYWLSQTGYPDNPTHGPLASTAGIAGMRADFAQGLPPQAWEYLINRTRARKWDFVFMAESLDGGPVTYRSARHFDVLNDSLIYDLHHAMTASDFDDVYESRRNSYGEALILLNTTSQDEDTYQNPYDAVMRFAVNSAMPGVTMIFPGQELGLVGTVVPPHDSVSALQPSGYARYDFDPTFHKPHPEFEDYNSLMPLWQRFSQNDAQTRHILALYSAIGDARGANPALRSSHRVFLHLLRGGSADHIFAVGKSEKAGADPGSSEVMFAFVNLSLNESSATPTNNGFDVDPGHQNIFDIRANHKYNVRNVAALDPAQRDKCLWKEDVSGSTVLGDGIAIKMNRVPTDESGWNNAPYEPQYLKLIDTTSSSSECRSR